MRLASSLRRTVSLVLAAVLLFSSWAVSGYACPGGMAAHAAAGAAQASATTAEVAPAADAGADQVDTDAPNLCLEHCRYGQQSADHASASAPALAVLMPLYPLAPTPAPQPGARPHPVRDAGLAAATPPHAILHCCLRT